MNMLDWLLGRDFQDNDLPKEQDPGDTETLLENHEEALMKVQRVLTDSQARVAEAIVSTGNALAAERRRERDH